MAAKFVMILDKKTNKYKRMLKIQKAPFTAVCDVRHHMRVHPKRTRKAPERFSEMTWIPGANNGYTRGRRIDHYDTAYCG